MLCLPLIERRCRRRRPFGVAVRCWLLFGLCGLACGCQSTGLNGKGTFYTPDSLPAHLIATKRDNAQTVDLSRLASLPVNSELIDRGDVIDVTIATGLNEKDNLAQPVRVRLDDGMAEIPIVGLVPVAGLELAESEAAISAAAIERGFYRNPHVTVTMKQQRMNRVTVVGAVKEPGVKLIPRAQCDLLAALMEAKGLSDDAGTSVDIRNPARPSLRPDPIAANGPDGINSVGHSQPGIFTGAITGEQRSSIRIDLVSAAKEGTGGYKVEDGAVVMVEKRDPEPVHVLGLVHKPDRYEFPIGQDLTVMQAIAKAGGVSSPVANKVFVIRKMPNTSETFITTLKISDAKRSAQNDLRLSPGDVVSVEQTPMTVLIDTLRLMNFGFGASLPLTTLLR